ncbi:sodium- and chloride-dependent taurine transporter-like [Watersipora subatra]|uniref:sodium- and chloride-dependent taurine transporter-like n=1 Tax=Watersipora subatra TaxID=2589382 RepID=UPI00355C6119
MSLETKDALVAEEREDNCALAVAPEQCSNSDDSDGASPTQSSLGKPAANTRETFTNKIDFLMACIGYSVGLGNFWRFPYLCYKNGGGAFLLPYFIMVVLAGIPMFFLEVSIGQFMSAGGIKVWNISPLFSGIGYATTIILFLLNCYYNVILSWAFYYLFASFNKVVPWSHCNHDWNTPYCRSEWDDKLVNGTTVNVTSASTVQNLTSGDKQQTYFVDPATEFWQRKVLAISSGIDEPGIIKWDLALCLLVAWIVVFACISKGVKSSGKVMYFTATTPYVFMLILLVRGCTLPGAGSGILYYLTPTMDKLGDMQTWVDAGTQIFFSYSIGMGASTALGSFNKFHHNCLRDSVIFSIINSGTSFLAGFVIFAVLGYMATEQGVDIADVAESGPGLAFIAYPKALSSMPFAPFWSVIFFLMVILLGLDSEFVQQEGLVATIVDVFPVFLRKGHRRTIFTGVACIVCYLVGLCMVTEGGMYVFQIFDFYSGSRIILLVALLECIAVAHVYGMSRFLDNVDMMFGIRNVPLRSIIKWLYIIITPLIILIVFVLNCISYCTLDYKFSAHYTYTYPQWAISVGWLMACSSIIFVPIYMIYLIINMLLTNGGYLDMRKLIRPRLLPHQMRPGDNPLDLNADATLENIFLPSDILSEYSGSLENYCRDAPVNNDARLPDYQEAVEMEKIQLTNA